jgi:hypothetical protein
MMLAKTNGAYSMETSSSFDYMASIGNNTRYWDLIHKKRQT